MSDRRKTIWLEMIANKVEILTWITAAFGFIAGASSAWSQPVNDPHPLTPLFKESCYLCHGSLIQTAGLNLSELVNQRPLVKNRDTWKRVMGALEVGKMPPPGAPQPSVEARAEMLEILRRDIDEFDYATIEKDPGFELMRRLTHTEYDNTVRDLFGVELNVTDRFPTELTGSSGFENSSNTLFLQPSLMERYIAAAQRVVDLALPREPNGIVQKSSHDLIFVAGPGDGVSEAEAARVVLQRFLERAYRRPPSSDEITRATEHFAVGTSVGLSYEAAIKQVLQAVLISPKFLLRVEAGPDDGEPFAVSTWELASRLSYFFWASMPDEELFDLAASGKLSDPEVLSFQVIRMLSDDRADTLGDVFAAQWLGFHNVGTRIWLDPIDNPWCTASLMKAMRDESSLFFLSLLRENLPIRTLIDADYTYVNEELATTLYEMEGVSGAHMRRVSLTNPNRGGVIGHASVLAVTSSYKDTSPVKRGKYVLDTLLGTPPPEPPPNVGVLSEEVAELKDLSFREKIEMHSSNEYCRGCHSRIDPIGFSLENFDYFGRWRDNYEFKQRVDTAEEADESFEIQTETSPDPVMIHLKNVQRDIASFGSLPGGPEFSGPAGLKQALLHDRHDDLVKQVVSKMLAYALGRQLEYYDEPAVLTIISALEADEYRFQTLLQGIVASYPFQYKKNPSGVSN
ncbi:MAG: DUF1592 domain-containing protein [Gammaproteobacteria bacterium]|nr:DUF1592 domain-containing protein [Gammaproteobacteria bacterium]